MMPGEELQVFEVVAGGEGGVGNNSKRASARYALLSPPSISTSRQSWRRRGEGLTFFPLPIRVMVARRGET
jgi:hypothetical protein